MYFKDGMIKHGQGVFDPVSPKPAIAKVTSVSSPSLSASSRLSTGPSGRKAENGLKQRLASTTTRDHRPRRLNSKWIYEYVLDAA